MAIQTPQWTRFLQCPICTNDFDEHSRQPISLGCGHTMCDSCLSKLPRTQTECPFDQAVVETDVSKLPFNYALLQLVGVEIPDDPLPAIESVQNNAAQYRAAKHAIEGLALFLQPAASGSNGMVNGNSNGSYCNGLTRPMQRKLVTLVNCQLAEADGRTRAMRAARSLGERTVTELILLHQNQQQLSAYLWAAVRNRGCQFLGPAMQEEALRLILLALEGGMPLSRKVLVLFVVQKLESLFPQASKTSIGHVVQLLNRASCFKVEKKNNESSLMQLKEQFRTYDALRKQHDAQIVQIATEAGLHILPDQWSSLLYGDLDHKSYMQSIIDKLQSLASFSHRIQWLIIALQRSGDPGELCKMRDQFEVLSEIDASPAAACPEWDELEKAMTAVHSVVHGLVNFSKFFSSSDAQSSTKTDDVIHPFTGQISERNEDMTEHHTVVPSEINLRGPLALEAYNKALAEGKACVKRVPVMLIGQDRSGKTSLKNSLMGKPFNEDEDSTVGIDVDPSYFKVSSEIWRPGENDQATTDIEATSFEHHTARLVAEELKEENRDTKSMQSENSASELPVDSRKSAPSSDISKDVTESIHTSKDPKVDVRKRVPNASSGPTQRRNEYSLLALPKIPDEIAILIKKIIKEVEKVQDEEEIYSVLWDFGGQSVYYATHPLFITTKAMYLLVFDLSRDPYAMAEPVVKQGKYWKILDNHGAKSNLDYLNFWMTSIVSLASQDEDQHVRSGRVQVNIPPVFLVCTHADEPYGGTNPLELAREILGFLMTKSYRNQLYKDVFVVNNKMSGTESECPEVIRLRENVLAVAKELPQMKEPIPIKWLRYERALQVTVKEGHKWIDFKMAKQIASEVCQIDDDKELSTLLDFLHDQRILIHFNDTPVLNNLVVLDPQWLVDVFKMVITVARYDQQEAEFEELWWRLESKGILDEKLLEHVWGSLLDEQETSASLTEMMEKFSLLCPLPSSDASCGKQYLVPSMLNCRPPKGAIELVDSTQIPSLFFKFESGQVPPGLFPRLVLQFFQWGQDEFWSSENPDLYHSFARFYTSADDDCSVILLCHSSSIEVAVHRGNVSADVTESLQSKLNISASFNCDAFEVACARAVRKKLGLMLECMREEFCWLKNMKYEVGVICPICCQGRVAKYNCMHPKQGCEQEECLHFWSESQLLSVKHSIRCCRLATAQINKVPVNQIAPWIETPSEQLTIVERDGRLLTPEEENDEKLLALPSKDLESLLSQPCDSKEVVLQLKDRLQLDQASLEQPDPGTKRLIRCLARKAKQSNRLDVFGHLREITPAGTTGPLLPECRDIRQIPFDQMRELTVMLSGGDEWKMLAAELGLKQHEIRYLDNHRIRNPCDALLAHIANQGYRSVGFLYNKLIKCKFPVVADLL